ncbi:MAG: hypothetical protein PHC88_12405 [Terrimicrobiaceae bacterium]|nr:hypothetical protein [Terrimicrobiaceae bacterium]
MKFKTLLLSSAVALALTGGASAQTVIRFTGSTAFRTQTLTAIFKVLGGTGTTLPVGSKYGYTGSSFVGSRAATFYGTFNAQPVIIKTSFSGSTGGIQVTAGSLSVKFIPPSADATLTQGGTSGIADPTTDPTLFENAIPDVTMMDTDQSTTPFLGTYLGSSYATLTATRVGIIPFVWVKSKLGAAGLTNMTNLLAQAQFIGTGRLPLALYTGNGADEGTEIFATGRDFDSGTRAISYVESGIGALTVTQQYDIATGNKYPAKVINGISFGIGNGGESSGGNLATKMTTTTAARTYVSYMGINDYEQFAAPGGATALDWNGVPYSLAAIIDGRYTFWSYENLGYRSSYAGLGKQFADSVATQITNETSLILLSDMKVSRAVDGGRVVNDY